MKLKILFVDDEQNIISGLKRMLHPMRNEWQMYFALSGMEALNILKETEVDIVITDMRMPIMDGATLLSKVKELYPHIIRIILSGYSDKELILKASKVTHQFLAKPIDALYLQKIIEQVYSLQSILHNQNIIRLTNGVKNLPSLPELYLKIEDEMRKKNPSVKNIDDIISQDIMMTAKILHVVNSAFFGFPQKIIDPLQAINFLGIEVVKSLVLMVHLFSESLDETLNLKIHKLWEESLRVANLSKEIAKEEKLDQKLIEESFISGLLHDIGKLVMWRVKDYEENVRQQMQEFNINSIEAEYAVYNTSHAEVGAYLLGIWGLPETLVEIVCFHHKPSDCRNKGFSPLTIVHAADHIISNELLDKSYMEDFMIESTINKWIRNFTKEENKNE
jgi:putative nucleotidyltransferase with HDIG domain